MDTALLTGMPVEDGEPVFAAPWQAKTFAMAVQLHESGVFTWVEWADELSAHIADFEKSSTIVDGNQYYMLWQGALEALVERKCHLIV